MFRGQVMTADKVSVLVVEDEPAIMELVIFTLKSAGWQPVMAESSAAAMHILERMTPDVILLDWMLPDESGIRFLKRLREDRDRKKPAGNHADCPRGGG